MPYIEDVKKPILIRDIIERRAGDFLRFSIGESQGKFYLMMEEKEMLDKYPMTHMNIETSAKRIEQLANEILSYLKKEAQMAEWKPSMQEFERKIKEVMGDHAIEFWIIDWVREVKSLGTKEEVEQAKRIYEWLHSNRDWLYGEDKSENSIYCSKCKRQCHIATCPQCGANL